MGPPSGSTKCSPRLVDRLRVCVSGTREVAPGDSAVPAPHKTRRAAKHSELAVGACKGHQRAGANAVLPVGGGLAKPDLALEDLLAARLAPGLVSRRQGDVLVVDHRVGCLHRDGTCGSKVRRRAMHTTVVDKRTAVAVDERTAVACETSARAVASRTERAKRGRSGRGLPQVLTEPGRFCM